MDPNIVVKPLDAAAKYGSAAPFIVTVLVFVAFLVICGYGLSRYMTTRDKTTNDYLTARDASWQETIKEVNAAHTLVIRDVNTAHANTIRDINAANAKTIEGIVAHVDGLGSCVQTAIKTCATIQEAQKGK